MTGIPNFDPIGDFINNFIGNFDGKWYEIQNLNINKPEDNLGLFGYIDTLAEIKNVGVGGSINGLKYVGGLVGFMNGGTVIGYNTAKVDGSQETGGLVGLMNGGTVTGYNTATVDGSANIGGLVGQMYNGTVVGYNTATVNGSSTSIAGLVSRIWDNGGKVTGYTPPLALNSSFLALVGRGGTVAGSNDIDITSATQATFSLFAFEDDPTAIPPIKKQWQWVEDGQWPILSGMPLPQ